MIHLSKQVVRIFIFYYINYRGKLCIEVKRASLVPYAILASSILKLKQINIKLILKYFIPEKQFSQWSSTMVIP